MLGSLFKRLGLSSAPTPAPVVLRAVAPIEALPVDAAAVVSVVQAPVTYGVRRPLISAKGDIAGFDFRLSESTQRRLLERNDASARAAHTAALLTAMRLTAQTGRVAYAELHADWLRAADLENLVTRGMVIGLLSEPSAEDWPQKAAVLRSAGVRVGWAEQLQLAVAPDFRLVRLSMQPLEGLSAIVQRWQTGHSGRALLATDAASVDELEAALRAGAQYASGELTVRDNGGAERPLPPQVLRIHRLLRTLAGNSDIRRLADDIKADVALTYRLLRFANSAAVGVSREVDSIEQAITLLGQNELHRWLSIMLINSADGRPAARALQEIALARAQLLESLAREHGDARPDGFFTLGLASMLGVLLQMPLAAAIEPLRLPEFARQALLESRGPWRPHLELALLLERQKTVAAESPSQAFGGIDRVLELADQAWTWAAESTTDLRG